MAGVHPTRGSAAVTLFLLTSRGALQRLEKDGLITSEWGTTDNNRKARYYRLTAAGRRALGKELESWRRFAAGLDAVLRTT